MSSTATEVNVVVLGHSFNGKLNGYTHSEWENLHIDISKVTVHCKSGSGGTFRHFCSKQFTDCLKPSNVRYVVCEIGGNDLDSGCN